MCSPFYASAPKANQLGSERAALSTTGLTVGLTTLTETQPIRQFLGLEPHPRRTIADHV
jgi:hypothetical protein